MTSKNIRIVSRTKDGIWANKKINSNKATSFHSTQSEAKEAASIMLRNGGGGDIVVMSPDGKIRSQDTIPPAYHVFKNIHGGWSVKKSGTEKAIKVFENREKAISFAEKRSKRGRNDLVIHSKDGRIRIKR